MSVDNWKPTAVTLAQPKSTLHFLGSITSKYRPVFGEYTPAGTLASGMIKDLKYPRDAAGNKIAPAPPYFLEPVNATWKRVDFTEIAFTATNPGLTPRPNTAAAISSGLTCLLTWPAATPYTPGCLIAP
jgi:hypothetical protein